MSKNDKELKLLAEEEWEIFKSLIGEKAVLRAVVIMLRRNGLSYGQIQKKTGISRDWAYRIYLKWHNETVEKSETHKSNLR